MVLYAVPSPVPTPETASVWSSTPIYAMIGAIVAALIAAAAALYQRRKNHELEEQKLALEQEKLSLEREKLRVTVDLETRAKDDKRLQESEQAERDAERERILAAEQSAALQSRESAYRVKLRRELSQLKILDMSRPLNLDKIFVQVKIRERKALRYVDDPELHNTRFDAPERRDDPRLAPPMENTPVVVAPVTALAKFHRIAVLGDPGAGKTTMLKHVASQMLRDDSRLPMFVELRRFVDAGQPSLVRYLCDLLHSRYSLVITEAMMEKRLEDGELVLLLDGLDEVLGDQHAGSAEAVYDRVSEEINRLATRFPDCPIAVTCRAHGWREGLPEFRTLEALDFDQPQMERFVLGWFSDQPAKGKALLQALDRNERLQGLAGNPLLLSLIAIVYEKDLELPERRSALYRRCIEVLLREWDSHRKIKRMSSFTTDRKEDLLKHLAWTYHREGRRYFATDDLINRIAQFLPSVDIDPAQAQAILDEIAAQYGLLKEQAHGWYGFLHLTLQEYFAASALLEQGQDGIDLLIRNRLDPWWEEVILLFAGATRDAGSLLRGILDAGDDIFHTDLFLAARCLAGVPRIQDAALRGEIVNAVRKIALSDRNAAAAQRASAIFIEATRWPRSEDELLELFHASDIPEYSRASHISAAATDRRPELAQWLLPLLTTTMFSTSWHQYLQAVADTRWQPAFDQLLEFSSKVDSAMMRSYLVEAAADIPDDIEVLKNTLRKLESDDALAPVFYRYKYYQAISKKATASDVEYIKDTLVSGDLNYSEAKVLADTLLDVAGSSAVAPLLDIGTAADSWHAMSVAAMVAVVDHVLETEDATVLTDRLPELLDRSRSSAATVYLTTEVLDHFPSLESVPVHVTGALRGTVSSADIGAAVTLTQRGDSRYVSDLRALFTSRVVPAANDAQTGWIYLQERISNRLALALARSDVDWLIAEVSRAFAKSVIKHLDATETFYISGLCQLMKVDEEQAWNILHKNFPRFEKGTFWAAGLHIALSRKLVPMAVAVLDKRWARKSSSSRFLLDEIVNSVSAIADDIEAVRVLARLHRGDPTSYVLNQALLEVSRRANVRVMPDGRLIELSSGLS